MHYDPDSLRDYSQANEPVLQLKRDTYREFIGRKFFGRDGEYRECNRQGFDL